MRPAAPEPGSEGRRTAARPLPGLRHAAPRPGGRERGGRESGAEPGRAGGWGRRGGGRGGPGAGRGGRGAAPGRAGPQGVRACSVLRRGEAGSDGHGRRSLALLLLPRSLPHTRAEGGEARSSHFPTFQTSQRNFFLSSPARASSSPIPPPFPRLFPAGRELPRAAARGRPGRGPLHRPRWAPRCRPPGYGNGVRTGLS